MSSPSDPVVERSASPVGLARSWLIHEAKNMIYIFFLDICFVNQPFFPAGLHQFLDCGLDGDEGEVYQVGGRVV